MSEEWCLHVNTAEVAAVCAADEPLLHVLRGELHLTGTRFGCGEGDCGACLVLLDGQPVASCQTPTSFAAGVSVTTVEGITGAGFGALVAEFEQQVAGQCGYCLSGMLIAATGLLLRVPEPSTDEIRSALNGNLCRCGAHLRIVRAVETAARSMSGDGTS